MTALVEEAHMLALKVAVHAHGADGIKDAIRAGADTIEHASLADAQAIALAKEKLVGRQQRETFRTALNAGVKIIFGTDGGVYPNGDNSKQFVTMLAWGMTPLQAIQSATVTAAQALGRSQDVGAIAVGRFADLIAVRGDPLADIATLQNVAFVMKGGVTFKIAP